MFILFAASVGCTRGGHQAPAPVNSAVEPLAPSLEVPAAPIERPPLPQPEPEWRIEKVNYDPNEAPLLACETQPCPVGVAFLSANEHVCTAFLAEEDVVITAAHCVSSGRMHIWFPSGERRTVIGTIRISPSVESLMPDVARLKLDRPARTQPLRLGRSGFPDNTMVKVTYWYKTANDRRVLSQGQCLIRQNTALFPLFKNDFDRVTAITDCDFNVQAGVSGAPVQNQAGEVIGVLGSYIETRDLPISTVMSARSIVLSPKVAIVTNLVCEDPIHPACRANFSEKDLNNEIRDLARSAIAPLSFRSSMDLTTQIDLWKASHSKVFRWKTIPQPDFNPAEEIFTETPLIAVPECFKPSKDWIADFRNYLVFLQSDARVRGSLQRWGTGVEIRNHVFQPVPVAVAFGHFILQFDPADLLAQRSTKVQMASVEDRVHAKVAVSRSFNLGFCGGR
jgi:hypothetical protein